MKTTKRNLLIVCLAIIFIFQSFISVAAAEKTPMDKYISGEKIVSYDSTYKDLLLSGYYFEIDSPYFREDRTPGTLSQNQRELAMTIVKGWANLINYEEKQGVATNDTVAADIYRCFKNGYAVCNICADDSASDLINIIFGTVDKDSLDIVRSYWLEWNLYTQKIRVLGGITGDDGVWNSHELISYSKPFSTWHNAAMSNAALFMSWDKAINVLWDQRSEFPAFMDDYYRISHKGKKPQISDSSSAGNTDSSTGSGSSGKATGTGSVPSGIKDSYSYGTSDNSIIRIKERLQKLGYYRKNVKLSGEANDALKDIVIQFQKNNSLEPDGVLDMELFEVLFSDNAIGK